MTKVLQFADDTTAVLSDVNSALVLFQSLKHFEILSGLKVNNSKTEGLWIGALKNNDSKPLGIKWPNEPIKALGVFFTYDKTLLYEKNFREKLASIKKLINIWSSRGLSLYGKVVIIKSLLLSKLMYISSLLPTPNYVIKEANQLLFKFLWKGVDKVTRLSTINSYKEGGLKMVELDSQIKALRLIWMKRIFTPGRSTWRSYLQYILKKNGGFLLFSCNYNMNLLEINSQFYRELLQWWAEFRDNFAEDKDWQFIIWNNKEVLIDNKLVYYGQYFRSGIISVNDLHFDVDNLTSYNRIAKEIDGSNFLTWTGLRNSVPPNLRQLYSSSTVDVCSTAKPSFKHSKCVFDVTKTKSKHYYALLIGAKARLPNNSTNLKRNSISQKNNLEKFIYSSILSLVKLT